MNGESSPDRPGPSPALPPSPSRSECFRLLSERSVPAHIREHCRVVAGLSAVLGADLASHGGLTIDLALLEAAALLHDIAKADAFGKPLRDHAREGGAFLRTLGYRQVAEIVEQHIYVTEDDCRRPPAEAQLLCYADKRVLHDRPVSLDDRYDDLVARYGTTPALAEAIEGNRALARRLEKKIFACLPYPPAELPGRLLP